MKAVPLLNTLLRKSLSILGWTVVGSGALVIAIGALIQSILWFLSPLTLWFLSQQGVPH